MPLLLAGHRLLAWEPGVGKTLPLVLAGEASGMPQLWVTLADLREQAARAIMEHRTDRPVVQVITTGRDIVSTQADVVVVSYDLMRTPQIWVQLMRLRWGSIVVDEAHAMAHTESVRARAFYGARQDSKGALFRRSPCVWLATGTPVLNNPMDLFAHVSRLWPEWLSEPRTKDGWMTHHCTTRPGEFGPVVIGARRPEELTRLLQAVGSLRVLELDARLDVDVITISLDAKTRAQIKAAATPEAWAAYEAMLAAIDGGEVFAQMQAEARLLPLTTARRILASAKARPVASLALAELEGGLRQIIIWGHHVEALSFITKALHKFSSALLNGSTSTAQRQRILEDFKTGRVRALVANMSVGGTGIDGLQCSHRALFLEGDWTPARNTQAIRRQFRQGQRHPVHASFTGVANSADDIVARVLARKARTITSITGAA